MFEYDRTETVESVSYRQVTNVGRSGKVTGEKDVLAVQTKEGGTYNINNTGFTGNNYALMFLAYCDSRPSELSATRGCVIPIEDNDGNPFPPDWVFELGKESLAESVWGPVVQEKIERRFA